VRTKVNTFNAHRFFFLRIHSGHLSNEPFPLSGGHEAARKASDCLAEMNHVKVSPIGPVHQNHSLPWLPPIKTLTNLSDDTTGKPASRHTLSCGSVTVPVPSPANNISSKGIDYPAAMAGVDTMYHGTHTTHSMDSMAMLANMIQEQQQQLFNKHQHGSYFGTPFDDGFVQLHAAAEEQGMGMAMAAAHAREPNMLYALQMLQREREQIRAQALHNELMMQSMLATTSTPAPIGAFQMSQGSDHGLWMPKASPFVAAHQSTMQQSLGHISSHPSVDSRATTNDYTSDDSSTSAGKRTHRESSVDSDAAARKKRMYVKSACNACRTSHIACDDSQPCRNCMRSGSQCQRMAELKVYVPPSVSGQQAKAPQAETPIPEDMTRTMELALLGRKYVKAACTCCRRSHLACDNYRPCRNCVRMGLSCEEVRSQRRTDDNSKRRRAAPTNMNPLSVPSAFSAFLAASNF